MVAVVSPTVSPCADPSRKLYLMRYKPPDHIEAHYMRRTHLPLSLLIATVFPGHFAEASVMCFDMVDSQGIEPRMPEAPDLQSGVVTNATRYP
jgi:hypothetical protein